MPCAHNIEFGNLMKILNDRTEKMVGEVLTIIEAVVSGDRQAEATKSTIKKLIWAFNRDLKAEIEKCKVSNEEMK